MNEYALAIGGLALILASESKSRLNVTILFIGGLCWIIKGIVG